MHSHFRIWLSRTIFESMLIVLSILLALAVREWQDKRGTEELIDRSMKSFERELVQNRKQIADLYPYHLGLQNLLAEIEVESHPDSARELRDILDGFQSAVLLTTAWDTALATGALAQMDYERVYALSLTYSIQERFRTLYNSGLINLLNSNQSTAGAPGLAYAALRYVNEVTSAESELLVVYQQALEQLGVHDVDAPTAPGSKVEIGQQGPARPAPEGARPEHATPDHPKPAAPTAEHPAAGEPTQARAPHARPGRAASH